MLEQMTKGIAGLHAMAAIALASPDFMLSELEAAKLAEATANVARWYVPLDPGQSKWWDIGALAFVGVTIYGPRMKMRRDAKRGKSQQPGA